MDNPRLTIDQIATIKNKEFESVIKSYWGKPHLQRLPFDRRSTDFYQLKTRFLACKEGYKDSQRDMKNYEKFMNECVTDIKKFDEADKETLERKKEILENVIDRAVEQNIPNEYLEKIYDLRDKFKGDTSLLDKKDQQAFLEIAGDIIDYRFDTEMDDTPWAKRVDGLADDLRWISSNDFNRDLPKLYEQKETQKGELKKWYKKWKVSRNKSDDFVQEGHRTAQRSKDLGFLDLRDLNLKD